MVGEQGGRGRAAARLTTGSPGVGSLTRGVRAAYDAAADDWAAGPEQMYGPLASALVDAAGAAVRLTGTAAAVRLAATAAAAGPLAGCVVLDLGAGTGVAGRAALAAGARRVVSADLAAGMLAHCGAALHPVAADAAALPFLDGSFDVVIAAFSLSHLPSIAVGLAEIRRVGRLAAASSFTPGWTHPAKVAVDEALRAFGYLAPAWYAALKDETEPQSADQALMAGLAAAAGFTDLRFSTVTVPTGIRTAAQLASWRLGMAHVAPFVRALEPDRRAGLRMAAERAVADAGCGPLTVPILVLIAR
jgi:ubiquinone/menaquinone biosynthesis C-methylase UbiE